MKTMYNNIKENFGKNQPYEKQKIINTNRQGKNKKILLP